MIAPLLLAAALLGTGGPADSIVVRIPRAASAPVLHERDAVIGPPGQEQGQDYIARRIDTFNDQLQAYGIAVNPFGRRIPSPGSRPRSSTPTPVSGRRARSPEVRWMRSTGSSRPSGQRSASSRGMPTTRTGCSASASAPTS